MVELTSLRKQASEKNRTKDHIVGRPRPSGVLTLNLRATARPLRLVACENPVRPDGSPEDASVFVEALDQRG